MSRLVHCSGARRGSARLIALVVLSLTVILIAGIAVVVARRWRQREEFEAPLKRGRILWRARRFDEAIAQFEAARRVNPTDPTALRGLAVCYRDRGKLTAASSWAERAFQHDATYRAGLLAGEIQLVLAGPWDALDAEVPDLTHAQRLYLDKAVEYAETTIARHPECGPAYRVLAEAEAHLGDLASAVAHLDKAVELEPESRLTRLAAIDIVWRAGQPDKALVHATHLIRTFGTSERLTRHARSQWLRALSRAADIHQALRNYDRAIELWQRFIKQGGEEGTAYVALTTCYFEKGDNENTVLTGDRALTVLGPEASSWPLHYARGRAFINLSSYDRAALELRKALAIHEDPSARYHLGIALLRGGNRDEARQAFVDALEAPAVGVLGHAEIVKARDELVRLFESDGHVDAALRELKEGVARWPQVPETYERLAAFCERHKFLAEAEEALLERVRRFSRSPRAAEDLCGFYLRHDHPARALPVVFHALGDQPESAPLLRLRARVEAALGQVEQAESHFERAVALDAAYAEAYLDWAEMRVHGGDVLGAEEVYERALRAIPHSRHVRRAYARFCFCEGRNEAGLETIEKLLATAGARGDLESLGILVDHLLAVGQAHRASTVAAQAGRRLPKSVEAHKLLARVHRASGSWEALLAVLGHIATSVDPDAFVVYERLAGCVHERLYDAAVEAGEDALKRHGERRRQIELDTAIARFLAGKEAEALDAAARAVSSDRQDCDAGFILSLMQLARGDDVLSAPACRDFALPDVALAAWMELATLSKGHPDTARRIARTLLVAHVYESVGWHDVAAAEVEKILEFAPDSLVACSLAPVLWERAGQRERAIAVCERGLKARRDLPHGKMMLADILVLDGQLDRAQELYREVGRGERTPFDAGTKLALLSEARGRPAAAAQAWSRVLHAEPRHVPGANNYAVLLASALDPKLDAARTAAGDALEAMGEHPAAFDTVGWTCYVRVKSGVAADPVEELRTAVDMLEKAVRAAPHKALYHYHLGMACIRLRESDRATVHLDEALRLDPAAEFAPEAVQALASLRFRR